MPLPPPTVTIAASPHVFSQVPAPIAPFTTISFAIPAGTWTAARWAIAGSICDTWPNPPNYGIASSSSPYLEYGSVATTPDHSVSQGFSGVNGPNFHPGCIDFDLTYSANPSVNDGLNIDGPPFGSGFIPMSQHIVDYGAAGGGSLVVKFWSAIERAGGTGPTQLYARYDSTKVELYLWGTLGLGTPPPSVIYTGPSNYEDEQGYYDETRNATVDAFNLSAQYQIVLEYFGNDYSFVETLSDLSPFRRNGIPITPATTLYPNLGDIDGKLITETRGRKYCLFYGSNRDPIGVYEAVSDDDGLSWQAAYLVFPGAHRPTIRRKRGAIMRMAFVPTVIAGTPQPYGHLVMSYQKDGDLNPGAESTVQGLSLLGFGGLPAPGSIGTLQVADDSFGLESLEEGADRWGLVVNMYIDSTHQLICEWTCADDANGTWVMVRD